MYMQRFVANLEEARKTALIAVKAKNNIARERALDLLDATVGNMVEELNTIVSQDNMPYLTVAKIDKDALLRSLLEDAEIQNR